MECGAIMPASKYRGKTGNGHIKTMWCYVCKDVKDFIQFDVEKIRR